MQAQCSVPDCLNRSQCRGWCQMHYMRWFRHGDIGPIPRPTVEQRFWRQVDPCRTDGCALWVGRTREGYGQFMVAGKTIQAHHFLIGAPPAGFVTDHVREKGCSSRACVWPGHLEVVTQKENVRRGYGHGHETHCPQGHPYDEANTWRSKRNMRFCRACNIQRTKERSQRLLLQ